MARLSTVLAGLLLLTALLNAVHQPFDIHHVFGSMFTAPDSATAVDRTYTATRDKILARGLTRLGYRTEPGSVWEQKSAEYFLIQYTLTPLVLRAHTTEDEWALVNYLAAKKPFTIPGLLLVEDFGNGLALYRKRPDPAPGIPQLGRIWHEQEGAWTGEWKRRGTSGVFDANWKGPQNAEIHDEIEFESLTGRDIVLYRRGTMGRYRGRLSDDGTKVEGGTADWFATTDSWAASIEK
jgi:hypothetical protein